MNPVQEQREFFSALIHPCNLCGKNVFQSVMSIAEGNSSTCSTCNHFYQQFQAYWGEITDRPDEIKTLAADPSARNLLRRVVTSYSFKGIHNPLILPTTIKLELTNKCNLKCKHCLANAGLSNKELSLRDIEHILLQAKPLGVQAIGLVGGEPLLRADLGDIIDRIYKLRMAFSISTNGTLIDEKKIETIKRKNLIKVSVSLDGTEEFHNELRGAPQAYQRALRGIKMLAEHEIKTAVAMVITRDNCRMIESVIQAAIENGATYFMVNDLIPVGRGAEISDQSLSYAEYQEHTSRMQEYRKVYGDKIDILWKGMRPAGKSDADIGHFIKSICGAALTELTIDHEGYVLPCPFLPKTNENIFEKSLKDIWYHSEELGEYQRRDDLKGGCGACSRKLSCSGCRARALGHTGDAKGPDIRCPVCQ